MNVLSASFRGLQPSAKRCFRALRALHEDRPSRNPVFNLDLTAFPGID